MEISKEYLEKFKKLYKEKYNIELTDQQNYNNASRFLNFVKILVDIETRDRQRKKKLEQFPDGFCLQNEGTYDCILCKRRMQNETAYYDDTGLKCIDCRHNIEKGIIPKEIFINRDSCYTTWELSYRFGLHNRTVAKMIRTGELKPRRLVDKDDNIYEDIFLKEENKILETLKKQK